MKAALFLTLVLTLALAVGSTAGAEEVTPADSTVSEKTGLKNQTHCPVMGGKIDSTVYTDIQGQRVYHCCPMCSGKLKEDPDKYFKKAAAAGVMFENIQTTCPVSGKELEEKSVYADYEGRRIYFCCEKCWAEFDAKPTAYLAKLEPVAKSDKSETIPDDKKEAESDHHDHSGHDH
jgi:YHS domain-containing protein